MPKFTMEVRLPGSKRGALGRRSRDSVLTEGNAGLFREDSVLRMTVSESVGLLGGGRSLLMQIAHPLVAAGVSDYSDFRSDPFARLQRTVDMTLGIILGDRAHATEVLRHFNAIHGRIQGRLSHDAGSFPAGTPYHAQDPALKLWVHATLIDGLILVYERFVRTLSPRERNSLYEDSRLLARYFGIPESMVPQTLEQFHEYMADMVNGDSLAVTKTTRSIARDILYPKNVPTASLAAGPLVRFVTAGLLPPRLRNDYGFRWSGRRQAALDSLSRAIRIGLPALPPLVRLMPQTGSGQIVRWAIQSRRQPSQCP